MQQNNHMFRFTPQLVMGLIIVTVGVLFTLDNLEFLNAREYLRYWPALLIVFGVSKMIYAHGGGRFFGGMLTVGGIFLLLDRLYYIDFNWGDFWPLIFIAIGGSMLWNSMSRRLSQTSETSSSGGSDSDMNHFVVMGGLELVNNSRQFRGGELSAIMGGIEVDLRQASIKDEAVIEIFALWGGISMKVPQDWTVSVQIAPIMGGVEDKTIPPKGEPKKRLIIKGTAIMGGAEIKN